MAKEEVKYFPWLCSSVAKTMWNLYRCGSMAVWLCMATIAKKGPQYTKSLDTSLNIKTVIIKVDMPHIKTKFSIVRISISIAKPSLAHHCSEIIALMAKWLLGINIYYLSRVGKKIEAA